MTQILWVDTATLTATESTGAPADAGVISFKGSFGIAALSLTGTVCQDLEDPGNVHTFAGAARVPRYLRQRQSPVRTPSRVRGIDLRQRQTPRI
jgi:hypothetical protein